MAGEQIAWVREETVARRTIRNDLRPFLLLARLTHRLAIRALALQQSRPVDSAGAVQARLLVQASNQLRLVELAAERGYPLQALGSAATLYEHVAAMGYIGRDGTKAQEWLNHKDHRRTYPPTKKRKTGIRLMLLAGGVSHSEANTLVQHWEDHHQRFCAAKHGNPTLLGRYGVTISTGQMTLHLGPINGSPYIALSRIALYHGSRLLADGSVFFVTPLMSPASPAVSDFNKARSQILARLVDLTRYSIVKRLDENDAA